LKILIILTKETKVYSTILDEFGILFNKRVMGSDAVVAPNHENVENF